MSSKEAANTQRSRALQCQTHGGEADPRGGSEHRKYVELIWATPRLQGSEGPAHIRLHGSARFALEVVVFCVSYPNALYRNSGYSGIIQIASA